MIAPYQVKAFFYPYTLHIIGLYASTWRRLTPHIIDTKVQSSLLNHQFVIIVGSCGERECKWSSHWIKSKHISWFYITSFNTQKFKILDMKILSLIYYSTFIFLFNVKLLTHTSTPLLTIYKICERELNQWKNKLTPTTYRTNNVLYLFIYLFLERQNHLLFVSKTIFKTKLHSSP